MHDLIIIGGGPAAAAATVYAARKRLKTLVIAEEIGGQSAVSETIYNWIGTPAISGGDLALALGAHMKSYVDDEILTLALGGRAERVTRDGDHFSVTVPGQFHTARAVLITSGSRRRELTIPGAAEYNNKGVMYCATCDGPLFAGQNVAVVGGGNAAFEAALQLAAYCPEVTLLHRRDVFTADEITVEKVRALPNVSLVTNVTLAEIHGERFANAISYKTADGELVTLPVGGIFVEIGQLPNTELAEGLVTLDQHKKIVVDPRTQRASVPGIWAAGDCTDGLYHQNNIAAGDAVKAIEDIYVWLKLQK